MSIPDEEGKRAIDGLDKGVVFYSPPCGPIVRLYERAKRESNLEAAASARSSGFNFDFAGNLDAIDMTA